MAIERCWSLLLAGSGLLMVAACAHVPVEQTAVGSASQPPTAATGPQKKEAAAPPPLKPTRPLAPPKGFLGPSLVASVEIAAVGDILPHNAVLNSAKAANQKGTDGASTNHGGFDDLFTAVREALKGADISLANLETPVAPSGQESKSFVFNAPPQLLAALKDAGIGLVSVANNHVYDQGLKGVVETVETLEHASMPFIGIGRTCQAASEAKILEVKDLKLAFLAAAQMFNNDLNKKPDKPCAARLVEKTLLEQAAAARKDGADLVFLSVHWGNEYQTVPRKEEVDLAHRLLDGGFDAIIGHHPHVLQPVEVYPAADGRLTFVAYSLGNFISNQSRFYAFGLQPLKAGYPRDGVLLRFKAVKKDYGDGQTTTELADLSVQPLWTENNAKVRLHDAKLPAWIRVVIDDTHLSEAEAALAVLDPKTDPKKALELKKQIEMFEARKNAAAEILGPDLLFEPAPPAEPPAATVQEP